MITVRQLRPTPQTHFRASTARNPLEIHNSTIPQMHKSTPTIPPQPAMGQLCFGGDELDKLHKNKALLRPVPSIPFSLPRS
jgi:hypothetical protein